MPRFCIWIAFIALGWTLAPLAANAQRICVPGLPCPPVYVDPACPPPLYISGPVEPVERAVPIEVATQWYQRLIGPGGAAVTGADEEAIRSWAMRAVRIRNGNSCGTGSLCGRDESGIYILTNAHVAGSKIGWVVQCEALRRDGGGTELFPARVVEAAYSSRTSTDWALLKADDYKMTGIDPIRLSRTPPDQSALTGTWGCPRCEVPSGQMLRTKTLGSIWYWQPNSIGGQSGSAVVQGGQQKGLLTWTIGGDGAGQLTSTIWRQSQERNTDGPARVDGMMFPSGLSPDVQLIEGYHAEAGLGEYPIWAEDAAPGPGPEPPAVTPDDPIQRDPLFRRLVDLLRRLRRDQQGWEQWIPIILQILEILLKNRTG